jgi:predicted transcriptional regulator
MAATTSLKLPEDLKEKIGKLAQGVAQTPHAYMVEAIAQKVERDEKRQDFLDAADKSRTHFKRTGIAYRHEDVWDYVMKLAKGQKARKPKPIRIPKSKR